MKSREGTEKLSDHRTVKHCEGILDFSVRVLNWLFPLTYIEEGLLRGFLLKNIFLVN